MTVAPIHTDRFWDSFVRNAWDGEPAYFPKATLGPFATPEELFELLLEAARRRNKSSNLVNMRFYLNGSNRTVFEDYKDFLPTPADGSLVEYNRRLEKTVPGGKWGIVLNEFHRYSPTLWERGREILFKLFDRIGLPGGQVTLDCFMGNYDRTPFGVHKDQFHVFTFPILGEKTIRLWPFQPLAKLANQSDSLLLVAGQTGIRDALPPGLESADLRASPGDVLYWNPTYWHIAHGGQGLNATITFGLQPTRRVQAWAETFFPKVETRFEPARMKIQQGSLLQNAQAKTLRTGLKLLAKEVASKAFQERLEDEWMKKLSSYGFVPPPDPVPGVEFTPRSRVQVDPRFPILTRSVGKNLRCYSNGTPFNVPASKTTQALVAHLNRGGVESVEALEKRCAAWAKRERKRFDPKIVGLLLKAFVSTRSARWVRENP